MTLKFYPIKCSNGLPTKEVVEAFRERLPLCGELIQPGEYRSWWEENRPNFKDYVQRASVVYPEKASHIIESVELKDGSLTAGIKLAKEIGSEPVFGLRGFCNHSVVDGVSVLDVVEIITFDLLAE